MKKEFIQIPVSDLIPYENNPRNNDEAVDDVAESMEQCGDLDPIEVDENNVILSGNTRLKAMLQRGQKTADVIRYTGLTEEQKKKYRLLANKTAEKSAWDFGKLEEELKDLDFNGFDFGFDLSTEDEPFEIEEDEIPEEAPTRCKKGEIWQLGDHRLMCGDSTDKDDVAALLGGDKADLLLTDPPYGINADKGFSGACGFNGDGKPIPRRTYSDTWDEERPSQEDFEKITQAADKAIIFGGNFFADILPQGNHWLVWNKHNTMPTFSDAELAWTNIKRNSVKLYDVEYNGLIGKEKERFHPTQKPVKLFALILSDYTKKNENIVDFFGGSGSTLIACEQTKRKCLMMELVPHYCDVIIERWENLTGKKAQKIG